jgi:hypothetical protein
MQPFFGMMKKSIIVTVGLACVKLDIKTCRTEPSLNADTPIELVGCNFLRGLDKRAFMP